MVCIKKSKVYTYSALFFGGESFTHLEDAADSIIERSEKCVHYIRLSNSNRMFTYREVIFCPGV